MNPQPPKKNSETKNAVFEELVFDYLSQKYLLTKGEILDLAKKKNIEHVKGIPLFILRDKALSSLEAIVKYLRENKNYSYSKIGQLLHRNPKTLAVSYAVARKKKPQAFSQHTESLEQQIPFTAFIPKLSILESICSYLKSQEHSYTTIARMLNKDSRTVWTVCKRAEKKLSVIKKSQSKKLTGTNEKR